MPRISTGLLTGAALLLTAGCARSGFDEIIVAEPMDAAALGVDANVTADSAFHPDVIAADLPIAEASPADDRSIVDAGIDLESGPRPDHEILRDRPAIDASVPDVPVVDAGVVLDAALAVDQGVSDLDWGLELPSLDQVRSPDGDLEVEAGAPDLPPRDRIVPIFDGPVLSDVLLRDTAGNMPPVGVNDRYRALRNTAIAILSPGVLLNDSDPDGDSLVVAIAGPVVNGQVNLSPDGSFTFDPNNGFTGTASFIYRASDGDLESALVTVEIDVISGSNEPPVAVDDVYPAQAGVGVVYDPPGVLENDSDPEGDRLTAYIVSLPVHGQFSFPGDGSVIYFPDAWYSGDDSFTYRACDNMLFSNLATVTFNVSAP